MLLQAFCLLHFLKAQNNEEKSTEVEAFDPLKPPRVRKKVTNRLSGKKKQVDSHFE